MTKKLKTKKCPTCNGKGRIRVDKTGLTKAERKFISAKYKDVWD